MNEFDITLPSETTIIIDVTDKSYYNYDFKSYSLIPLQQSAGLTVANNIKKELFSRISQASLIEKLVHKNETEYVANLSDYAKEKLNSGEWTFGIRKKTGETYAVIKDTVTGKNQSFVNLDKRIVNDLGTLPELSAIQGQLAALTKQIEDLNRLVERVEQGQYNDRYAGFFSARQLVVEGLAANDNKYFVLVRPPGVQFLTLYVKDLLGSLYTISDKIIDELNCIFYNLTHLSYKNM